MNWTYQTYDHMYRHPTLEYTAHEKFGRRMLRYRFDNVYGAEVVIQDGERFEVTYMKYSSVAGQMGTQSYDTYLDVDAEELTAIIDEMSTRHMGRVATLEELNLY